MPNKQKTAGKTVKRFVNRYLFGYMMLAPFFLLFFIFTLLPVIISFVDSFYNYDMINTRTFAGFTNFLELFTGDDVFITSIGNTLIFALIAGPVGFIMSFLFAWVIDQLRFSKGFALAFYAPSIVSGIAISVVWLYFFSPDRLGLINDVLIRTGLISTPILWTSDPSTIMVVIVIISLWMSMGSGFLTNLAGLKTIPDSYYEAGYIDGIQSRAQELYYITIPSMKPMLLYNAITSVVASFSVFDIAVSVSGFPSPGYAGHTVVAHLYDNAFVRFDMGYASAIAVVLFIMTFSLSRLFMRIFSSKGE